MRVFLFLVTVVTAQILSALVSSKADQIDGRLMVAQIQPPTLRQGPPIQCTPNVSMEWKPTVMCGTNEAGWIGGEHKCWNYYDSSSNSCQRKCEWTGKCNEP